MLMLCMREKGLKEAAKCWVLTKQTDTISEAEKTIMFKDEHKLPGNLPQPPIATS